MKRTARMIFLVVLIISLSACISAAPENNGDVAPKFNLIDLQGNSHDLAQYKGKKVYLKFWASWCSICLAGMEELNTLAAEDNDFIVLSIVSPSSNAEKDAKSFAKWFEGVENTSNIQVLLDEGGAVFEDYGVLAYPTSVYIGTDGKLIKSAPGHFSNDEIKETFANIN